MGLMRPIGYYLHSKKGVMLTFECMLCFEKKVNKAFLPPFDSSSDDYDLILTLPEKLMIG
jgi:hypothetical protein